ncbi:MAG: TerB family tellurite resistance protein [Candidatus Delongbacteria bacterium]|nr:TerB family tellurite resistance protein [Candidatus Delongbacteria bacterium]MBN2836976.1 TerB family tellurite resistance protein [Candidatus Delongbacteria bacterium]
MALKHTFFGAAVGFILSGPIGGVLGAVLGSLIPDSSKKNEEISKESETPKKNTSEFTYSLLILFAVVIKADSSTRRSEILFVKNYLISKFGSENAQEMMQILKALLEKDIEIEKVCRQIYQNTDYYFRVELVHLLFKLATADAELTSAEFNEIKRISIYLQISHLDFRRLSAMFTFFGGSGSHKSDTQNKLDNAYSVLGVDKNISLEDLKKVYRKLSKEYHPDRVTHLGEEYQKIAEEKFIKIKDAYETVKKSLE